MDYECPSMMDYIIVQVKKICLPSLIRECSSVMEQGSKTCKKKKKKKI